MVKRSNQVILILINIGVLVGKSDYKTLSRYVSSYLGNLKTHEVCINDQEWKYIEGGKGEETIIFIHGLMGSKMLWRSLMQHYMADYRVIALDIPGLFVEQRLQTKRHTFRELSNWLELFLEHLKVERFHLVAHSVGCGIGTHFASTRPSRVSSIALLNHIDVCTDFNTSGKDRAIDGYLEDTDPTSLDSLEAWNSLFLKMFYVPPKVPQVIQRYRYRSFMKHYNGFVRVVEELNELKPMALSYLRKIKCPVLTVNSSHDRFSSDSFYETLKHQVPWGQHVMIEQCGHMSFIEKHEQVVNSHHAFLKNLSPLAPKVVCELS